MMVDSIQNCADHYIKSIFPVRLQTPYLARQKMQVRRVTHHYFELIKGKKLLLIYECVAGIDSAADRLKSIILAPITGYDGG